MLIVVTRSISETLAIFFFKAYSTTFPGCRVYHNLIINRPEKKARGEEEKNEKFFELLGKNQRPGLQ